MTARFPFRAALVIAVALVSTLGGQTVAEAGANPEGPFNLRIPGGARAVLVEVHERAKGMATFKRGAAELNHEIDHAADIRWVDEVGPPGGAATYHKRNFIEYKKSDAGAIKDPGLEGVTIEFTRVDDDVKAKAREPRHVLKDQLKRQVIHEPAIGFWVELPGHAVVGQKIKFPGEALLATILNLEEEPTDFKSELNLDRVDAARARAHLSGAAAFTVLFQAHGVAFTSRYEGEVALEVDLMNRVVANVSFVGTSTMKGRGKSADSFSGEVAFDARGSARVVTDAASHRVKKPAFRENSYLLGSIAFQLPSCWMGIPDQPRGTMSFADSRHQDVASIEVRISDEKVDPTDQRFIDGFMSVARKEAPDITIEKATFTLGDGFTFECSAGTGQKVRGVVAPWSDGIIRVRFVGSPTALKKAEADYKALIASLAEEKH